MHTTACVDLRRFVYVGFPQYYVHAQHYAFPIRLLILQVPMRSCLFTTNLLVEGFVLILRLTKILDSHFLSALQNVSLKPSLPCFLLVGRYSSAGQPPAEMGDGGTGVLPCSTISSSRIREEKVPLFPVQFDLITIFFIYPHSSSAAVFSYPVR